LLATLPFSLNPGESILWQARPPFPKLLAVSFVLLLFVLVDVHALGALGYFHATIIVDVIAFVVSVGGLVSFWLLRRAQFIITDKRIVKIANSYGRKRTFEIALGSLAQVEPKRVRGKQYVSFVSSPGGTRVVFGPLRADPERVREIALRARSGVA
jgi:hypothetical protein